MKSGKFVEVDGRRFLIRGVAYGTFEPDADGSQFPPLQQVARDFALMADSGLNTVRTYTVPTPGVLDEAARHGLKVMAGIPWTQHVAFLDDRALRRQIRREAAASVRALASHPAALLFAVGNEIPPAVVRWHGRRRVERFLRELYDEVKAAAPSSLSTYVNFPPTEYLDTEIFDVCAFNVYLHREPDLRAYLARLQHLAGERPLLLAEAGADSIREGADGQAAITAAHIRTAFAEGACGAIAFSWTDDWWRGGHTVRDWAFGLVDADRHPKPALAAVREAFADAPFSAADRASWPTVSVVVCAYNAGDTIDDCLASLGALTYPRFEIIVVNDGSRDDTGTRARRYPGVRVLDIPNGGLSAARNVGLAEATGDIVAYTDADVRVDRDWLSYLVQPLLSPSFVGSGGPNVVPPDDPFVAQCVARSPGGPTQVLLDDRVAEHVPGCNMAFRRDALAGIGGFNPVYLRAGDDVDVCWRLQAKGLQIGFAPAAVVWHHHRGSVKAYWRQQVGYGEGETWLDAHHPEKFIGGQMLWRGHIYSPLPFVRSLSGRRINTGVWGTAAFPGIYRTDVSPLQFVPHSASWMAVSTLLCLAGMPAALVVAYPVEALLLLAAGLLGWGTTIVRCSLFASRTDLSGLPGATTWRGQLRYRALIAWLHLVQPVARVCGRVRGMMSPPTVGAPEHVTRAPWKAPVPSPRDAVRSALLLLGGSAQRSFWSERWTSHSALLTELAGVLRAARPARPIEEDDGWRASRDLSVAVRRWGWLHLRVLVEEHAEGRCLLRVETRMGPSFVGAVQALTLAILLVAVTSAAIALRWPAISGASVLAVSIILMRALWHTTRAAALVDRAVDRATLAEGFAPIRSRVPATRARFRLWPATAAQRAQAALVAIMMASVAVGGVSLVQDVVARRALAARRAAAPRDAAASALTAPSGGITIDSAGDVLVADAQTGLIRRFRPQSALDALRASDRSSRRLVGAPVPFDGAADIVLAVDGDYFVADSRNNRICRIDRPTGRTITIAGSGAGGFDGDRKQAAQASLNGPSGLAVARNGDLYIADTLNNRVRVVEQATGMIRTIAGSGATGDPSMVGDGGPATAAHLSSPVGVALAPNGDVYIADTGHNRIRRVEAATGIITTVAGDGLPGMVGDGGPASMARLAAPMGLAVVSVGKTVTLYIADSLNGRIRVIEPDGTISTLGGQLRFVMPSRLSYHHSGWLYVKDASSSGVTAVSLSKPAHLDFAATPRRAPGTPGMPGKPGRKVT
ncbi:MAG TPA: glycosyltransferase [Vicinamibacterales bacterium]|nr:glycosyltransferase [Vicinamibacterales bacterium]